MKRSVAATWSTAAALTLFLAVGCASDPEDSRRDAEARMLGERTHRSWTPVETAPGGPTPVEVALAQSRARIAPYLQREAALVQARGSGESAASAASGLPAVEPISLHLRGTPLSEAVDMLARPLGLNVVLPRDLSEPVTVSFPSIDPRVALDAVLSQHGYVLREERGVHHIRRKDAAEDLVTETMIVRSGRALPEAQLRTFLTPRGSLQLDGSMTQLVVTDERDAVQRLRAWLNIADQRSPQVLIDALIMEVQRDTGLGIGMIASFENNQIGQFETNAVSTLPLAAGAATGTLPFTFNVFSDDWDAILELTAQANTSHINVLSNPLLTTVSGKEARLDVIEKIPYVEATQQITVDGGGSQSSAQTITFADVGVRLKVTPHVGGDQIIEMMVEPEVLELVDFVLGVPVIDERKVATTVHVRNNETIVLAGLLRESSQHLEDKVPLLGDIPLLGNLFKRTRKSTEKHELLIFLTPHLISPGREPEQGFQAIDHLLFDHKRFPQIDQSLTRQSLDHR